MPKGNVPKGIAIAQRRRGPRGDITRADIVAAAERVLAAKGLAGVSTRSVASEAGVSPNSLYTYVHDMDDLLNLVGDKFLAGLDLSVLDDPDPARGLRAVLGQVLHRLAETPGMDGLLASRRIIGPGSLSLNEALLGRLLEAGLPLRRAAAGVYALTAYLYGHLVCMLPDGADDTVGRSLAALDPADYPFTAATPSDEDELPGLDMILAGVLGAE